MKVIDVTVPLQCLVKDSKLILTEASKVRRPRGQTTVVSGRGRPGPLIAAAPSTVPAFAVHMLLAPKLEPHGAFPPSLPPFLRPSTSKHLLSAYCVPGTAASRTYNLPLQSLHSVHSLPCSRKTVRFRGTFEAHAGAWV